MTYKTLSNHVHSTTRLTHDDIIFQQRLELAAKRVVEEVVKEIDWNGDWNWEPSLLFLMQ